MIDREHNLPIIRQRKFLKINRGSVYYLPHPVSPADLAIMRRLDQLHLKFPFRLSRSGARPVQPRGAVVARLDQDDSRILRRDDGGRSR